MQSNTKQSPIRLYDRIWLFCLVCLSAFSQFWLFTIAQEYDWCSNSCVDERNKKTLVASLLHPICTRSSWFIACLSVINGNIVRQMRLILHLISSSGRRERRQTLGIFSPLKSVGPSQPTKQWMETFSCNWWEVDDYGVYCRYSYVVD